MTPALGRLVHSIRLNAPRGLKLPACCRSSSLNGTGKSRPKSAPLTLSKGVRRVYADIRAAAATISLRVIIGRDADMAVGEQQAALPFRRASSQIAPSCKSTGAVLADLAK